MASFVNGDRLAEIQARADAATPGPWFDFHVDDHYAMNCYGVSTEEGYDEDVYPSDRPGAPAQRIVALTLFQAQRTVCHKAGLWDRDAAFIAHAREDVPWLLARVRELEDAFAAAPPSPPLIEALDAGLVAEVDAILDENVSEVYKQQPLAQHWARVAKAGEEAGEAVDALILWTGQNPRKPQRDDAYDALLDELADTALAGVYAMQHFTKDTDETMRRLRDRLVLHHARLAALAAARGETREGDPFDYSREDTTLERHLNDRDQAPRYAAGETREAGEDWGHDDCEVCKSAREAGAG